MKIEIVLVIIIGATTWYAWNNAEIQRKFIFNAYLIHQKNEWWRFITSGFIHADYMHLGFNLYVLYSFGELLTPIFFGTLGNNPYEQELFQNLYGFGMGESRGTVSFVLLFVFGVVVSGIPDYFRYKDSPSYNSLGASGGVSSIVFASIVLVPDGELSFLFIPVGFNSALFGIAYLGYSHWASRNGKDNINHSAHFWGGIFGIVFTLLIYPDAVDVFIGGLYRIFS